MIDYSIRSAQRKLKFLADESSDRQSIFSVYEDDFNKVVSIARGNIRVEQDQLVLRQNLEKAQKRAEEAQSVIEEEPEPEDIPQKKLYRKIAKQTHPDRYDMLGVSDEEKQELQKYFTKASAAYEQDNVSEMIRLALALDISIDDLGLDESVILSYLTKAITQIEDEISTMESSFVWMWGKALGNLEMRVRLLDAYLRQTGHPPVSNTILRDIIRHHEDPSAPKDGSRGRRTRKKGERPKKLIR